jgi:hypothetical protein
MTGRTGRRVTGRHGRRPAHPMPWSRRSPVWSSSGRPFPALSARSFGRTLFRDEALQARARGTETPNVEARLGARWITWLYRLALALVAAGVLVTVTARSAQESDGTAVVSREDGRFAALLPLATIPDLAHASALTVVLDGSPPIRVILARVQLAEPSLVRHAGLAQPSQPCILLTGRLAPGATPRPGGGSGRVITPVALVIRSQPVGAIVAGEFEVMLGKGS